MADYNGTDEDDIIDASELDSDIGNIYPGKGNDTVTNATSKHTIITGPGEDNISGEKFGYALWNATQAVTINLKENWSEDGFGTRDTISGVETIHGSSFGDTMYGSENYEKYFVNGGNNTIDGGGGNDRATYAPGRGPSTNFEITYIDGSAHVKGENTLDILKNVSTIEFMDDAKIFSVDNENGNIRLGETFYGTENYDHFFINEGNNIVYAGGGDDLVSYKNGNSKDYSITLVDDEIHIISPTTKDIIIGGRYVEFMDDNKLIDTDYLKKPILSSYVKLVHTFEDDTRTESYTYSGVTYESGLINWFPQKVFIFDVNDDGEDDVILPMGKAYAQKGINSSTPFIALTVKDGELIFDKDINDTMPIDAAAGRSKPLFLKATDSLSFITSNIYTAAEIDRVNPDYSITPPSNLKLTQKIGKYIDPEDIFPTLPGAVDGFPLAVDAHSMATGDINGDGLDDIFMGRMQQDAGYELLQQEDGSFILNRQDVYKTLHSWPLTNESSHSNLLLDSDLIDINNDGYDDLIVGFGHGSASSLILVNDDGKFSENNIIKMPDSIYGVDNQMHLLTFPADFDHDGDIDIGILWTRYEPYYGGYYIQFNLNDGNGNFTDVTNFIPANATQDAYQGRLTWVEPWQMIDINNDGHIDLAGSRSPDALNNYEPIVYFNDGAGRFEIKAVGAEITSKGKPYAWGDFDNDGKVEYVTFKQDTIFNNGSAIKNNLDFHLFEYDKILNTGPNFINASDQGAPGFNERYYLNENTSAQEAVKAGTYATGLEHYLAEGKEAGFKTFAPFTKVHGYSGNDNIVMREGDEIALGYGGNDTIEGGAGNDTIDGGAGSDTAVFRDTYESYTLTHNDDGSLTVKHNPSSSDTTDEGIDTLKNIEKLQFSDLTTSTIQSKYSLSSELDLSKNILEPFSETSKSGTLNFSSGDNIIVADGQAKTLRGLDGNDTYFVSNLLPKNSTIEVIDTSGSNTIQIAANTKIIKTLWTKDATRLTFEDDRVITINGADNFTFNMGGNITNGTDGIDLTFAEFALSFGIDDILNLSGSDTGTVTDMYII